MSNLYKRYHLVNKNDRIIDYNDVIKTKLEIVLKSQKDGFDASGEFVAGLDVDVVEGIPGEDTSEALISQAEAENAAAKAESVLEEAKQEAESILALARQQAEEIKNGAYNEGQEASKREIEEYLAQKELTQHTEFENKQMQLKQEYDDLKSKIEPELVHVITGVFKKIFNVMSDIDENLILNLVNNVMHNSEVGKEFTIRTSPEDYNFLVNNQGKIYCATSKDVSLEIVEDAGMKKSQCIIESDLGVYDCSLDIQLENIIKQLKLLSCIE